MNCMPELEGKRTVLLYSAVQKRTRGASRQPSLGGVGRGLHSIDVPVELVQFPLGERNKVPCPVAKFARYTVYRHHPKLA